MGDQEPVGGGLPEEQQAEAITGIIRMTVEEPARPSTPLDQPLESLQEYFRWYWHFFHDLGAPKLIAYMLAGICSLPMAGLSAAIHVLVAVIPAATPPLARGVLELMDTLRKDLDVDSARFSVVVLNEILGTDFGEQDLATSKDVGAHIQRAQRIGQLFHQQLFGEFAAKGDLTEDSGRTAAQRFTGFLINFGMATGLIGLIGELASFGLFGEFREIGVQVARNLGLGRMHRMVMKPLFTTLIATPYQWYLNRTVHPKRFSASEAINAFTGTLIDETVLFKDLELEGWSPDRIKQLIRLHQKKLDKTQVEILVRNKQWTRELGIDYLKKQGWSAENADLVLAVAVLERFDKRVNAFVDALEKDVVDGALSLEEMVSVLDSLPLDFAEKQLITTIVTYRQRIPRAQITLAQMEQAFEQGLVDLTEFDAYLQRRGYSRDDGTILTQLTLLKLGQLKEKKKAADERRARKHATETAIAARAPKKKPPA